MKKYKCVLCGEEEDQNKTHKMIFLNGYCLHRKCMVFGILGISIANTPELKEEARHLYDSLWIGIMEEQSEFFELMRLYVMYECDP